MIACTRRRFQMIAENHFSLFIDWIRSRLFALQHIRLHSFNNQSAYMRFYYYNAQFPATVNEINDLFALSALSDIFSHINCCENEFNCTPLWSRCVFFYVSTSFWIADSIKKQRETTTTTKNT